MTTTAVAGAARPRDTVIDAASPAGFPRFWLFQIVGWLAYAVAMTMSRVGIFPLRYMVVGKGVLAITGLLYSLVLWRVYRRLLRRDPTVVQIVVVSVIASYLIAALWTATDNVVDIPIAKALLGREHVIRSVFQLFVGSVYNAFTMLAWSLLYFGVKHYDALQTERERTLRAEAMAQRAQLEALRYQIHPHFLFNTLNAISTLVVDKRNDDASRMISRLSDFLRLTLSGPVVDEVSVTEEIDFVRRYLDIEQVRFGDRLTVQIDVASDAWAARLPYLILQPVVENAIRHGVAPREGGGRVRIAVTRDGARLRIVVADDGAPWSADSSRGGERIGLANTRERLRRLYDDAQRLDIESTDQGTRVTIELPFHASTA
jgi:two-component system, LytTR family, sensor kinase